MALPSESSTPPQGQGLPYPPGDSKLEMMPTEILSQIFGKLAQIDFQPETRWMVDEDNQKARKNIRSLCLTSKRVDSVARPLLLENITIDFPAQLLRLYETVLSSKQLGNHIREIKFEILGRETRLWDFLPLRTPRCANRVMGWQGDLWNEGIDRDRTSIRYFDSCCCEEILSSAYFEILRCTPNLRRLSLRMPPTPNIDCADESIFMYEPFMTRVEKAVRASMTDQGSVFLPQLTTLRLLGDQWQSENQFDIAICVPLLQIPTLEKFITFRDNGNWSCVMARIPSPSKPDCAFKSVRVAELQQSFLLSRDFRAFGALFAGLEVLTLSSRCNFTTEYLASRDLANDTASGRDDDHVSFQDSLIQMKNLHTLVLDFHHRNAVQEMECWSPKIPTLASLPKLATIKVPFQVLMRDQQISSCNRADRLVEFFPKSLKQLILVVEMGCSEHGLDGTLSGDSDWPTSSMLVEVVEALSSLAPATFPDLQEVALYYNVNNHEDFPGSSVARCRDEYSRTDPTFFGDDEDLLQRYLQAQQSLQQQHIRLSDTYEGVSCPYYPEDEMSDYDSSISEWPTKVTD